MMRGRSLFIGSFCPVMTSLSRYLEEAAFSKSIDYIVVIIAINNLFVTFKIRSDEVHDEGRSLYIGSFCPAMTSLSRYLEETAFSKSIDYIVVIIVY